MMRAMALVGALLAASPAFAQDETVGLKVKEWFESMHGTIQSNEAPLNGSTVNLADELGLGDQERAHEVQGYLQVPMLGRFTGGAWWMSTQGSSTLSETIVFAGQTFTQKDEVSSSVDLESYYLTYEFRFPTIPLPEDSGIHLGLEAGLRALRGKGSIEDSMGNSGKAHGTAGLPVVGGHAEVDLLGWVRAEAELSGLAIAYSSYHASYFEANAELDVTPFRWLYAGIGYKWVDLHVRHTGSTGFDIDAGLKGLYVSAAIRF